MRTIQQKIMLWAAACLLLIAAPLHAQDLTGDWTGVLEGTHLGVAMRIAKESKTTLSLSFYSLSQSGLIPIQGASPTLQGSTFRFNVPTIRGSYEGTLAPGAASIRGRWTQGSSSINLDFKRVPLKDSPLRDASPPLAETLPCPINSGSF